MHDVQSPAVVPDPGDLAWISDLLANAVSKLIEVDEYLAGAFEMEKVGEHTYSSRREFEPPSLEDLARLLLLVRDARSSASALVEHAGNIEQHAFSLFTEQEDTGQGVVTSPAGVEAYVDYRRRLAERFRAEADDAEMVLGQIERSGDDA